MAIRKIPEDTGCYHYHNENPKNKRAGDCVFRAIATATGQTWDETLTGLTELALKLKLAPNERACYERYLKNLGWVKHKQPRNSDGTKMRAYEFVPFQKGRVIFGIQPHHLSCSVNRKIYDTWDCSHGAVGNYWTKQ